jgi:polysaccharide pyruvyl transferase WcaK-like protein/MoaA/NifB/PqqE/SkfB family radical SAM enzyme
LLFRPQASRDPSIGRDLMTVPFGDLATVVRTASAPAIALAGEALWQAASARITGVREALGVVRPRVVNFQANDICNHRCVMCRIWEQKRGDELSPGELRTLLSDPWFSAVEHVGITGGEPTLRPDLPELYRAVREALPALVAGSFITNGFLVDRVISLYETIHQDYHAAGKQFGGMISIDGVGEVHDTVRGTRGAFERATRTLFGLRDRGIAVHACCTIVKANVAGVHDLLRWGQTHGVYVRFRIGEFINRLYNAGLGEQIRNFDRHETRHLVSFLHLLIERYEPDAAVRRTYGSMLSLLTGGPRLIACPYQDSTAINVDSLGRFAYCAPKGTPHALAGDAEAAVRGHRFERLAIRRTQCDSCIHDYHDEWAAGPAWLAARAPSAATALHGASDRDFPDDDAPTQPFDVTRLQRILLVGWYGTETAGDAAILAGILIEYLERNPALRFVLLSLYPYYSRLMLQDFPPALAARVELAGYESVLAFEAASRCDAVVMAGGPLMDIPQTRLIADLFLHFHRSSRPAAIEGCGIGPLNNETWRRNVAWTARLASRIAVRDSGSAALLRSMGIRKPIEVRRDPSITFLERLDAPSPSAPRGAVIRCFLRELTHEYPQATSPAAADDAIAGFLERLLAWYPDDTIELWPMHYFPVGNDDREFARRMVERIGNGRLRWEQWPRSAEEIARSMTGARFCICMRFHSVVFAATLGVPFFAIDYTAGGKIHGFLQDRDMLGRSVTLAQLPAVTLDALRPATNPVPVEAPR